MPFPRPFLTTAAAGLALLLGGCSLTGHGADGTNPRMAAGSSAQLRPGDSLTVSLTGIPDPTTSAVQIDDQGLISLIYLGPVHAAGLTANELGQAVRRAYIDRKFYNDITVAVNVTERYVYIGGEVQRPGRITWSPDLTLSKSIQAAGGFSLYAKKTRVTLTRDRQAYDFDVLLAQRKPEEDPLLLPGDSIQVPRSPF